VVAHEVKAGRRYQGRELLDQFLGLEDDVRRAIAPAMLEAVQEPPVLEPREPLGCDRRTGHVAAQALQTLAIARRDGDVRVQAHAARTGAAFAFEGAEELGVDAVAHTQHALAGTPACGDATGDRGPVQCRE
jgi:hypothetical protein